MSSLNPANSGNKLFIALLVLLVWAPLPFGSKGDVAQHAMVALVYALAGAWAISYARGQQSVAPLVKKAWPLWLSLLLVQLWMAAQWALGISVSPYDTLVDLQLGCALTLFCLLTLQLVNSQQRLQTLAVVLVAAGTFQAFYGSFMALSGLEYSFFSKKWQFLGMATGTYPARNHFAGYLEMTLAVGIGLMLSQLRSDRAGNWRERWRRMLETLLSPKFMLRLFLAIMVIGLVLSRSRMGNTAFFVAMTSCGFLALFLMQKATRNTVIFFASLLVIDILIVSNWFGIEKLVERMQATSTQTESRDEVARDTWVMVQQNWLTGTGAGTFYTAYPKYRGPDVRGYQFSAHNDYLEFASELGVVGMVPLSAAVLSSLWLGLRAQRVRRTRLYKGMGFACTMGIVALLIHSTVDLNLQIPANALTFVVILCLGWLAYYLPRE